MKLTAADVLRRYKDEELPEFCELVLQHVNQPGNFGNLPIHVASVRGNIEEMEALIAGGADVNAAGELGNRPLHEAVGQRHKAAVELLLSAGADANAANNDGRNALEVAEILGFQDIVSLIKGWSSHSGRIH
jgi:ankyrin repeat protein